MARAIKSEEALKLEIFCNEMQILIVRRVHLKTNRQFNPNWATISSIRSENKEMTKLFKEQILTSSSC